MERERLDRLLVDRGLVSSRERGRALIMAGAVLVGDRVVDKSGTLVPVDAPIRIRGGDIPYVSRGGIKLAHALDTFQIDPSGLVAIDVGASTGGFTDCLLQRGASRVYAVDVGYGQLAWSLRNDPRVVSLEKTNIRHLEPGRLGDLPSLAVIDASFISLSKVLPSTVRILTDEALIIALVKPQFEVGKGEVGKGGVVRDERKHREVVASVSSLAPTLGLEVIGVTESPIVGAKGNREFLMLFRRMPSKEVRDE
ncbi:MAG: TlyA family rRNA (cytidine-2'-O)-methyltransferase [Desulfuromonadia bacterium]